MNLLHRPSVLTFLALASFVACTNDSTAGRRVALQTTMSVEREASATFTTGLGWDVTLTKAAVAVAGLYYFDGPPLTASTKPSLKTRLADLFIGKAWAHPGHYQAGSALGQVLLSNSVTLDLLSGQPATLAMGEGVTGIYRSARVVLPARAPEDALLEGHLALAEGTAKRHDDPGSAPLRFRLVAGVADLASSMASGAIDGCVLEPGEVDGDGTINLEVRPTVWFGLVDFSKLDPNVPEVHDPGFVQGVAQLRAYRFAYRR